MEPIRSEFEDDPDIMEIVQEFAAELPGRARMLEDSFAGGDLEQVRTIAHQLKGAGGGYGFPQITEAAARLEAGVKEAAESSTLKDRLVGLCDVLRAVVVPEAS